MISEPSDNDKVDLFINIINSEEGRSKNIKAKGIMGRKILLDIKRKIYNIPLIGYFVRLGINICLLPQKIKQIQNSICNIYDTVRSMNGRLNKAEVFEKQLEADVIERYSSLNSRTEKLEKYRLNRINIKKKMKRKKKEKKYYWISFTLDTKNFLCLIQEKK